MRFSTILTKNVISLYNGTNEGVVISGRFDEHLKKLTTLEIVCEEDNNLTDEYLLLIKNVYLIGEDAVLIKNNTQLELKTDNDENRYSPINSLAYDTSGKLLGKVTDIEFDDKFNITKFVLDENEIEANKMASFSNGTIIFYAKNSNIKVERFRPIVAKIKINEIKKLENDLPKAYILPTYETTENSNLLNGTNNETINEFTNSKNDKFIKSPINARIERLSANSNLLIGKKITKNISTTNGEIICKKGNLVTSKTIYLATAHQKLRELVLYSE